MSVSQHSEDDPSPHTSQHPIILYVTSLRQWIMNFEYLVTDKWTNNLTKSVLITMIDVSNNGNFRKYVLINIFIHYSIHCDFKLIHFRF